MSFNKEKGNFFIKISYNLYNKRDTTSFVIFQNNNIVQIQILVAYCNS